MPRALSIPEANKGAWVVLASAIVLSHLIGLLNPLAGEPFELFPRVCRERLTLVNEASI